MSDRTWIAMFSHTGTELANIISKLKIVPDRVITNQSIDNISDQFKTILVGDMVHCAVTPTGADYERLFSRGNPIITLHGWMRIIPGSVCEHNEIYNLHPGDIVRYPELKGKDPQLKAWESEHDKAGCVLHRCTAELDSGPIINRKWFHNKYDNYNDFNNRLRKESLTCWTNFLRGVL